MMDERIKLKRQNATVTKETVDLELVRDVSDEIPKDPRMLLKITDLPINWEEVLSSAPLNYDFATWKQSKIANGTWVHSEPSGTGSSTVKLRKKGPNFPYLNK